jgi:hypothetical protein
MGKELGRLVQWELKGVEISVGTRSEIKRLMPWVCKMFNYN